MVTPPMPHLLLEVSTSVASRATPRSTLKFGGGAPHKPPAAPACVPRPRER